MSRITFRARHRLRPVLADGFEAFRAGCNRLVGRAERRRSAAAVDRDMDFGGQPSTTATGILPGRTGAVIVGAHGRTAHIGSKPLPRNRYLLVATAWSRAGCRPCSSDEQVAYGPVPLGEIAPWCPVRNAHGMPFKTRRSPLRSGPWHRAASRRDHSASVSSCLKLDIFTSCTQHLYIVSNLSMNPRTDMRLAIKRSSASMWLQDVPCTVRDFYIMFVLFYLKLNLFGTENNFLKTSFVDLRHDRISHVYDTKCFLWSLSRTPRRFRPSILTLEVLE